MPTPIAASNIVAQAFRFMELAPISSFDDDSEKALAAAEQYPNAMDLCLEATDWAFASTLAFLPPTVLLATDAIDPDYPYTFELPGNCVRIHEVGDGDVRWRRDMLGLRADHPGPLRIRFTAGITDEAALPAAFRLAVSLHLAVLLSPRWPTSQSKLQMMQQQAAAALKTAMRQDARNASQARYDGLCDQGDWSTDATL